MLKRHIHPHNYYSGDGCVLASTLCKYDLRKGDLFALSWARVRRVRLGSISSVLLMCGGGVHSILLLPLVARCLETIYVCICHMSVVVTVCGSVGMFVVYWPLLKIVFFSLGVLKYVVCLCRRCDGCCVFCLNCVAVRRLTGDLIKKLLYGCTNINYETTKCLQCRVNLFSLRVVC